jgi:two-component system, cell cycle sensor histidine kinase PleC
MTLKSAAALTTVPTKDALGPVVHARLRRTQITLNVRSMRMNAYAMPVWAVFLSTLFSPSAPIGYTPWTVWWVWPAACALVAIAAHLVARNFRVDDNTDAETLERWYRCVLALHLGVGVVWGLGVWIHWQEGNAANHLFLFVIAISAAALYAIVRAGDFNIVLVGTLPLMTSLWLHFLGQEIPFDLMLSIILPLWSLQFYRDTKSGCAAMLVAHVTRIEKEQMAEDLVRARDEAQAQHAKAVRANASKTAFLANMSHELRTPLNAILGFSEVISTEAFGPNAHERYRDYAADILTSGTHLLSLINDLLDVAKIEAGKLELDFQWLDSESLTESCVRVSQERAQAKGVALSAAFDARVTKLFVDERAFKQIALNLISNAIKFTPEGGGILVQLKPAVGGVELAVKDTGCGIPAAQLERVFEPFEQVDNRYARANGGTGLGLTLVRALAELHGGKCSIESQEGRGTIVRVILPFPADVTNVTSRATALSA